jgi:acetolactate decarboxylase
LRINRYQIIISLCFIISLLANYAAQAKNVDVHWSGQIKDVHNGNDLSAHIDINDIEPKTNLWAIGPIEFLEGEITIWDGLPLIAKVINHKIEISHDWQTKACFLVYSRVNNWHKITIEKELTNNNIESVIENTAHKFNLSLNKPFAFQLKGQAIKSQFHVMHNKQKIVFQLNEEPIEIIGFYSQSHQGIFTHQNSNVHMHIKNKKGSVCGHLESFILKPGAKIFYPNK